MKTLKGRFYCKPESRAHEPRRAGVGIRGGVHAPGQRRLHGNRGSAARRSRQLTLFPASTAPAQLSLSPSAWRGTAPRPFASRYNIQVTPPIPNALRCGASAMDNQNDQTQRGECNAETLHILDCLEQSKPIAFSAVVSHPDSCTEVLGSNPV